MKTLHAPVNKIVRFSNVDGPGNRTAIFFQSCPFKCAYCHNPETINLCNNCLKCVPKCPTESLSVVNNKVVWDQSKCIDCDACIKTCDNNSSPKILNLTTDKLMLEINKQKGFIRGITTSGGECMTHALFLEELFIKAKKEGYTCLIDSNGYYDFSKYPKLLDVCDGVMLDIKAFNNDFHKLLTHKPNNIVINNLNYLLKINKLTEVRTVLLPNFDKENEYTIKQVSKIIQDKVPYKLLKYRPYGVTVLGANFCGHQVYDSNKAITLQKLATNLNATKTIII